MNVGELLGPWVALAAVLVPLVYAERWIHSHLFGVAWLATNSTRSATALYYLLLLPGVFVHELTQYLVAGALNIPIQRVIAWPEAQEDGTLRLDFVQVKNARRLSAAIIGAAPLLVGLGIVWILSNQVLDLDAVVEALATGDWRQIGPALGDMVSKPDFFLWLYIVFAVSNAMLPTASDRRGWPLLLSVFAITLVVLLLVGVGDVLLEVFTTSVAVQVERLAAALATVLLVEILGIGFIGVLEEVLERATRRKFTYRREERATRRQASARQPGSSAPLPPGAPLPSIYNLDLPVPLPSDARRSAAPVGARSGTPAAPLPVATTEGFRSTAVPGEAPGLAPTVDHGPTPRATAEIPPKTADAHFGPGSPTTTGQPSRSRPGLDAPERAEPPPRKADRPLGRPLGSPAAALDDEAEANRTSVGERTGFFGRQGLIDRPEAGAGPSGVSAPPTSEADPAARMGRSLGLNRAASPSDADQNAPPARTSGPGGISARSPFAADDEDQRPARGGGPPGTPRRKPPFDDGEPAEGVISGYAADEDADESDDLEYIPFDDVDLT